MTRRATICALLLALGLVAGCECNIGECCPPAGCVDSDPCSCEVPCNTPCHLGPVPCPSSPCCESSPSGKSAQQWAADLRSDDRATREHAIDALARMGPSSISEVELLLTDPSPIVRYSALQVFVRLRHEAWPAVHDLKIRLADQDAAVRAEAAYVISMTGMHAVEAIPELICALTDTSPAVRYRAAVAFQTMGSRAEPARAALDRVTQCDRDSRVREAARCALYRLDEAICKQPDVPRPY
jgi:hypothetical protein